MYNPEQPVFEEQPESNIEIAYGIEDVPKPWWKAVLFALQITLVDFTPFMWAAGFASLAGIDQPDFVPTLLCACFFCMGICTFLQTTVGNRLPIVQGSSSALMSSMGNIAAVYGLPAVWGASLIGGLIQTILGITKTVSKVRAFLPPVVVGSVDSHWVCRSENRGSVDFFQTGTIISGSCADFVFVGAYTEI